MAKDKGGRPTKFNDVTRQSIKDGYSMGLNTTEVALYAEIARGTLYEYLKQNEEFAELCDALKENVKMIAKRNVYTEIAAGDQKTSQWYLERQAKGFNDKKTVEHEGIAMPTEIVIRAGSGDTE